MENFPVSRLITAFVIILIGLAFLLMNLGIIDGNVWANVYKFWPVVFVVLGIKATFDRNYSGALSLFFWGGMFFVGTFLGWNTFALLWPLIIIWVGVLIIVNRFEATSRNIERGVLRQDHITRSVFFSGADEKVESSNFKGGKVDAVFGGVQLDLREAVIDPNGAELEVNAIFGGVEIYVSESQRIEAMGTGILGGWENRFQSSNTGPVLKLKGTAVFGGVEVKN